MGGYCLGFQLGFSWTVGVPRHREEGGRIWLGKCILEKIIAWELQAAQVRREIELKILAGVPCCSFDFVDGEISGILSKVPLHRLDLEEAGMIDWPRLGAMASPLLVQFGRQHCVIVRTQILDSILS